MPPIHPQLASRWRVNVCIPLLPLYANMEWCPGQIYLLPRQQSGASSFHFQRTISFSWLTVQVSEARSIRDQSVDANMKDTPLRTGSGSARNKARQTRGTRHKTCSSRSKTQSYNLSPKISIPWDSKQRTLTLPKALTYRSHPPYFSSYSDKVTGWPHDESEFDSRQGQELFSSASRASHSGSHSMGKRG